ncbi:hypothetical protein WG66_002590 [Moniliophthora roreri]|nr:hypothetical protein WG66_002590 [Moniliophthora roreri]
MERASRGLSCKENTEPHHRRKVKLNLRVSVPKTLTAEKKIKSASKRADKHSLRIRIRDFRAKRASLRVIRRIQLQIDYARSVAEEHKHVIHSISYKQ